jgi:hypothetical protein
MVQRQIEQMQRMISRVGRDSKPEVGEALSTSSLPILNFPIDCLMATSESETTLISRIAASDRRAAIALLEMRSAEVTVQINATVSRSKRISGGHSKTHQLLRHSSVSTNQGQLR